MPEFTAKDVQALRQATGAGMMDAKKALAGERRRHRGRHPVAAREGPGQGRPSCGDRENTPGRGGRGRRRQRRRHRRAQERDRLRGQGRRLHLARRRTWPSWWWPRAPTPCPSGPPSSTTSRSPRRRTSSWARSCASRRPTATCSTPTSTSRTAAASTPCWSSWPAGTRELAHDIAVHIAFAKPPYLTRDEVPGRRGREGAPGAARASPRPRASPSRPGPRSSRAGSTPGSRIRCCSSRASSATTRPPITQLLGGATLVRFAQVYIGS